MHVLRIVSVVVGIGLAMVLVNSCKDLGDPLPPPPIVLGHTAVNVAVGDSNSTSITGGTPPYRIVSVGDPSKVTASIAGSTLRCRGLAAGSTVVTVGDNGSPAQTASINVTVLLLAVSQDGFRLLVGDSSTTTIYGGTPPYSFASKGDTTVVSPSLSGSTLKLRTVGAGSSTIVISDNGTPQLTVAVHVDAVLISFSRQVQPIFTARCVNAGCHPGGGAPFPLQAPQSYANLVNVQANQAPCADLKRVQPGDAANSALFRRIEGTCGDRMPLNLAQLLQAERDTIRYWINQGAPNN